MSHASVACNRQDWSTRLQTKSVARNMSVATLIGASDCWEGNEALVGPAASKKVRCSFQAVGLSPRIAARDGDAEFSYFQAPHRSSSFIMKVKELRKRFPSVPEGVVASMLESSNGDVCEAESVIGHICEAGAANSNSSLDSTVKKTGRKRRCPDEFLVRSPHGFGGPSSLNRLSGDGTSEGRETLSDFSIGSGLMGGGMTGGNSVGIPEGIGVGDSMDSRRCHISSHPNQVNFNDSSTNSESMSSRNLDCFGPHSMAADMDRNMTLSSLCAKPNGADSTSTLIGDHSTRHTDDDTASYTHDLNPGVIEEKLVQSKANQKILARAVYSQYQTIEFLKASLEEKKEENRYMSEETLGLRVQVRKQREAYTTLQLYVAAALEGNTNASTAIYDNRAAAAAIIGSRQNQQSFPFGSSGDNFFGGSFENQFSNRFGGGHDVF